MDNLEHSARRCLQRRAFSLLELMVVIGLIGMMATVAFGTLGVNTSENIAAEGFARRLKLDLMQTRRRTIATGDNHYLSVTLNGAAIDSYQMIRRASGGDTVVDSAQQSPDGVAAIPSHTTMEFDFDGAALAAYSISIDGSSRSWQIDSVISTGTISIVETTP